MFLDYRATLHRDQHGGWLGRDVVAASPDMPRDAVLTLSNGSLDLVVPLESPLTQLWIDGAQFPVTTAQFSAGRLFQDLVRDRDSLRVFSHYDDDVGLMLGRDGALVIALGSLDGRVELPDLSVELDRCVEEDDWPQLSRELAQGMELIWMDVRGGGVEALTERVRVLPPRERGYALAVAMDGSRASRRQVDTLTSRVFSSGAGTYVRWLVPIPARFRSRDAWLSYINALPREWTPQAIIRVIRGDEHTELGDGEYRFFAPWHVYVGRAGRFAAFEESADCASSVGIAMSAPGVTEASLRTAVEEFGCRLFP